MTNTTQTADAIQQLVNLTKERQAAQQAKLATIVVVAKGNPSTDTK